MTEEERKVCELIKKGYSLQDIRFRLSIGSQTMERIKVRLIEAGHIKNRGPRKGYEVLVQL